MDEHAKEPLKVVDRRLFTRDGERRVPEAAEVPAWASREPEPPPAPPEPASPVDGDAVPETPADPLFESLVGFLAESAMMGLRQGGTVNHFAVFIDFLELIRTKMRGNLAPAEADILDDALGQMKMVFLQLQKKPGGGGKA